MCAKSHTIICLQMFGIFHTCVGKATDMLISPWAMGVPWRYPRIYHYIIREDGQPMYLGHRNSVLYYNASLPSWVWYDRKDSKSVAVSISPESSLFLGLLRCWYNNVNVFEGVHDVDFSGVRDDKCHTGVGESRVRREKYTNIQFLILIPLNSLWPF